MTGGIYVIYSILRAAGIGFRDYEEECYGDDEAAYYDGHGLSLESYLDECSTLTVSPDRFKVIDYTHG